MEIIIETDHQLRIYIKLAEKLKLAIDHFSPPKDTDPIIAKAMLDGIESVYKDVIDEINDFVSK